MSRRPEEIRRELGIRQEQVVLSVTGEAGPGKGVGLILDSLERVPPSQRPQMFFIFAGKARDHTAAEVRVRLLGAGVEGRVDLRETADPRQYAVLTAYRQSAALVEGLRREVATLKDEPPAGEREQLQREIATSLAERAQLSAELDKIRGSTSWLITSPLRRILGPRPRATRLMRRGLKLAWGTVTFRLPSKLRARAQRARERAAG